LPEVQTNKQTLATPQKSYATRTYEEIMDYNDDVLESDKITIANYKFAAEQGDVEAQYRLAVNFIDGKVIRRNFEKAAIWLRKSSAQGYADAQYLLGIMHEGGEGATQDFHQATAYMHMAAKQGHAEAQAWLDGRKSGSDHGFHNQ
jgi:TPR repeat protein